MYLVYFSYLSKEIDKLKTNNVKFYQTISMQTQFLLYKINKRKLIQDITKRNNSKKKKQETTINACCNIVSFQNHYRPFLKKQSVSGSTKRPKRTVQDKTV